MHGILHPTPVVLAGGTSTRFGDADKLRVAVRDRSLIDWVVRTVDDVFSEKPLVVCRTPEQCEAIGEVLASPDRVRFGTDHPDFGGPIAGMFGAIDAIRTEWMFVVAGDMPAVSSHTISWLQHMGNDESSDAVVPSPGPDMYEPLLAFYRRDALEEVRGTITDDVGPRTVIQSLPDVDFVSLEAAPDEVERSLANVNTKADLRKLTFPEENH